jgi:signal transduction histidine kinase
VSDLVERLMLHRTLGRAPRAELEWIAARGTLVYMDQSYLLANEGDGVLAMWILLTGHLSIRIDRGTGPRTALEWRGGDVSGLLPYSRMVSAPGNVVVHEPCEMVRLDKEHMPGLIRECQEVTAILVHVMLDRARQFTSHDFHDEKMRSLGRLAAGLAHELNNPASAVVRGAKALVVSLDDAEVADRTLGATCSSTAVLDAVDRLRATHWADAAMTPRSPVERADREEAWEAWLKAHGVQLTNVEALAHSSLEFAHMDELAAIVRNDSKVLSAAIRAIAVSRTTRHLAWQVETAASRIHGLVSAVKGFTHLDQAAVLSPVNLGQGLRDTLAVLGSKAKSKSIELTLKVADDLPTIMGVGGELNQVWSNLLDNALDAAPKEGHVEVLAERQGKDVLVRVIDDGAGIPPDLAKRIFDPFYTTKPVGEGTGLGLDISRRLVRRHDGQIEFTSRPGRTEFRVTLPGPAAS